MRDLKFREKYKLRRTQIEMGKYLHDTDKKYYEKVSTVFTNKGIVVVIEWDWETNSKPIRFTCFKTLINGWIYEADLNEKRLSEMQIKWLATHFINTIFKAL